MRRILHLAAMLLISINLFAQAPQKMSYQAVIRNASNNLVTNAPVKMRISILQGSNPGTSVYSELHSATTNANGLVSIEIGNGTSQQGTFSNINWGNGTYFLKTETDPTNGGNYSIVGTSQLLSVPYALESNNAKNADDAKSAGDGIKGVSNDTLTLNNGDKYVIPGIKKIGNPPSTINNGLIAYYPFSGNANDESGNANNGTVNGATLTSDRFGNSNKAYSFDGVNDFISTPNVSIQGKASRSITFWIKTSSTVSGSSMIVATGVGDNSVNGGTFNLRLVNSNKNIGFMGGNFTSSNFDYFPTNGATLNDGNWHQIVVNFELNTFKFFVDGVLDNTTNLNISTVGQTNFIGKSNDANFFNASWFNGLIDDVRYYNRVLTQEEITYLANN